MSGATATVVTAAGAAAGIPVADLVVVTEFGEPIFPGLDRLGSTSGGGDKPAHVVINAENHQLGVSSRRANGVRPPA